jgi:hypothetical protein
MSDEISASAQSASGRKTWSVFFYRVLKVTPADGYSFLATGCTHKHPTQADAWNCPSPIEMIVERHEAEDGETVNLSIITRGES